MQTIDPGMLYFGEFCKDLLRSVWFWNQVSKVESAFNVKYTDRVLLKQVRLIILVQLRNNSNF
jgi:hypothetical protein